MDLLFFFRVSVSLESERGGINSNLVEGLFWGFALFSSLHTVVGGLRSGHFKSTTIPAQGRHETSKEKQIDITFHPRVPKGEDPELLASSEARYFHFHKIFKQLVCETGRPYLVRRGAIDTALKVEYDSNSVNCAAVSVLWKRRKNMIYCNGTPVVKNALMVVTSVDLHAGFMEIL